MIHPGKQWLIDLGNSRIKCAPLDARGRRGEVFAIDHEHADPLHLLVQHVGAVTDGDQAWIASVAAVDRTDALVEALRRAGLAVHCIETQARCGKLRIAYAEPWRLGVDRFLAMLAASERDDGPWLVLSAGSALTVDLLGADGVHHGGMIAPMPADMRAALARRFTQLDLPPGKAMDFADNSADAIASGARAALLGLVERALHKGRVLLGVEPTLLLSGGGVDALSGVNAARSILLASLVLDGMALYVRTVER